MMNRQLPLLARLAIVGGVLWTVLPLGVSRAEAQGYDVLHGFSGIDGANPEARLVEGSDGALYGTTAYGGNLDLGVVFKINKDGSGFLKLHDFQGGDGANSSAGLVQASDGALYGTTVYGGGSGTIFKINTDGSGFLNLHDFNGGDGYLPYAGLVEASDGALYGTTYGGGANSYGVIFRVNKDGTEFEKLYDFGFAPEGEAPLAGLIQASDGALYGTTKYATSYAGVVFKINTDGTGYLAIHGFGFGDYLNGALPHAEVVEGSDGGLYGTTEKGGPTDSGIAFKINKDGTGFLKLHDFNFGDAANGATPYAGLVQASDGALYGTTIYGGAYGGGIAFRVNKDGSGFRKLHAFTGSDRTDGTQPYAGLVQASDGAFYGTARNGGSGNGGVVFRLAPSCEASLQVQGDVHTPGSTIPVQVHLAHYRPKVVTVPWEMRLLDARGQVIARHTAAPHTFEPGDVVDREVEFRLTDDLASGTYTLELAISGMAGTKGAKTTFRVIRAE